jgi:glycosyltransferase involved in cell wall biosynthesis
MACFCVKSEELTTTSPTRLFEYVACGKPVFVTKGYRDSVPCEALIEVSQGDLDGAAQRVLRIFRDASVRDRLATTAREFALQHASWDSVARRVKSVFEAELALTRHTHRRR